MRDATEILPFNEDIPNAGYWSQKGGRIVDYDDAIQAIKTAQSEAIREAAKAAKSYVNRTPDAFGEEVAKSILQLLDKIK